MKHPRPYQLRIAPNRLWLHNSQGGSWRSHLLRIFLIQRHLLRVMLRCFTGQATSLKHRDAEISWRHVYHVFTIYLSYIYHISIYIYISSYLYHWIGWLDWTSTLIQLQEWPLSLSPSIDGRMAGTFGEIMGTHKCSIHFNTIYNHIYANAKTHNPQSVSQWFVGHLITIKCIHIVHSILAYTSIVSPVATAGARLPFATWSISFIGPNLSGSCHLENQHISSGPSSAPLVVPQQSFAAPRTLFKPNGSHLKLSCRPIPITPYDTSWYPMNILIHVSFKNQLQKRSKPFVSCYVTLSHGDPSCPGEVPPSEEFVAGWMMMNGWRLRLGINGMVPLVMNNLAPCRLKQWPSMTINDHQWPPITKRIQPVPLHKWPGHSQATFHLGKRVDRISLLQCTVFHLPSARILASYYR